MIEHSIRKNYNHDTVIRGDKNRKLTYTYKLTFTKTENAKTMKYCSNCGNKIDINSSGKCEYCNATIINKETKWIMTKKQMLNQK